MTSLFQNASQAQHYASARPTYPKAIFQKIYDAVNKCCPTKQGETIWRAADVGCGSGQATVALADYFDSVIGIDPSPSQIQQAIPHKNVQYFVGTATDAQLLEPQGFVCITAAQAAHWFDLPKFYEVANQALLRGGVLALIVYGNAMFPQDQVLEQKVMVDLYENILGEYWDPRRRIVENMYRELDTIDQYYYDDFETKVFPNDETVHDEIWNNALGKIEVDFTPAQLLGYLRSWSGYTKCVEAMSSFQENTESDPLYDIFQYLNASEDQTKIRIVWPLKLVLSTKKDLSRSTL